MNIQVIDTNDPPPFGRCIDTKVYIADVTGYALIVYDSATNRSWKILNKLVCNLQEMVFFIILNFFHQTVPSRP